MREKNSAVSGHRRISVSASSTVICIFSSAVSSREVAWVIA
jgi:hypothetical protein